MKTKIKCILHTYLVLLIPVFASTGLLFHPNNIFADVISLTDGSVINGKIKSESDDQIVLKNAYGKFNIKKSYIKTSLKMNVKKTYLYTRLKTLHLLQIMMTVY